MCAQVQQKIVEIVKARPAQQQDIITLWRRFTHEENQAVTEIVTPQTETNWIGRLNTQIQKGQLLVAIQAQLLVGFIGYLTHEHQAWVPARSAYVVDLYVIPEKRGSQIGQKLILTLGDLIGTTFSEIWANTHQNNKRMQAILVKLGFERLPDCKIPNLKNQHYFRLPLPAASQEHT